MEKGRKLKQISLNLSAEQKGITPIIAIVLLLLITIVIIGIAFTWLTAIQQSTQDETGTAFETQTDRMQTLFRIEGMSGNQIYLRNSGSTTIRKADIDVFYNNKIDEENLELEDIPPGKVGTLTILNTDLYEDTAYEENIIEIYSISIRVCIEVERN